MKKAICLGLVIAASVVTTSLLVPLHTFALAQQPASPVAQFCPVVIQDNHQGGFGDSLHFTNQGTHVISAVVFHATRLNAVGEEVGPNAAESQVLAAFNSTPDDRSEQTFVAKKGLQPLQQAKMSNNMAVYGHPMKGSKFMYYVRAVKFEDGSTWKDDGSHSCQWGGQ